jgi:pilus assembly protein CpaB
MITVGKRAISVRVNDVVGVAGFALPGNYVDILVSAKDGTGQPFSKTVLNHVKVLAIAQDTTADPAKPKVVNAVTLELTPSEAEQLDLARSIGTLSLVLRNEIDSLELKSGGASLKDITQHKELQADNVKSVKSSGKKYRTVPKKLKEQSDKMLEIRGVKENEYKESTI